MITMVTRSSKFEFEHNGDTGSTDHPRRTFAQIVKSEIGRGPTEQSLYSMAVPHWNGASVTYTLTFHPASRVSHVWSITFEAK